MEPFVPSPSVSSGVANFAQAALVGLADFAQRLRCDNSSPQIIPELPSSYGDC